ncbi:hypothetical protein ACFQEU_02300, partial [Halorubrum tibetense]
VTDLEERTRQLHVLDNILRHNIRNELNVIHGRGEQLQRNLEGEPKAAAGTIVDRAETLLTTSEKSREITAVLSDPREPTSVDIGQVVRGLAEETADDWPNADVDVTGPTELVVSATGSIAAAIEELLTNAVIHNDSENPHVRVNLAVEGSWGQSTTLEVRSASTSASHAVPRLQSGFRWQLLCSSLIEYYLFGVFRENVVYCPSDPSKCNS